MYWSRASRKSLRKSGFDQAKRLFLTAHLCNQSSLLLLFVFFCFFLFWFALFRNIQWGENLVRFQRLCKNSSTFITNGVDIQIQWSDNSQAASNVSVNVSPVSLPHLRGLENSMIIQSRPGTGNSTQNCQHPLPPRHSSPSPISRVASQVHNYRD